MQKTLASVFDPKRIEKQNAAFHRMSNKRQRIAIAKDVLMQLRKEMYVATPGTYIDVLGLDWHSGQQVLQEYLLNTKAECHVCGIGAAFLSLARLGNKVSLRTDYKGTLRDIFGEEETHLIECLFENWTEGESEEAVRFVKKYPDPTKRLAAIFRNIAKHGKLKL